MITIPVVTDRCAGIDAGKRGRAVAVAVGPADNEAEIRTRWYGTTVPALRELQAWLQELGCTSVAMEGTGSYWIPVKNILEEDCYHVPRVMRGKLGFVLRHLFLFYGLAALGLFVAVDVLDRAGAMETVQALAGPMHVLIVPLYVVCLLLTVAQGAVFGPNALHGLLGPVVLGVDLVTSLAPFALADYALDRLISRLRHG
jgi:hypothetical protein